jgi:hypothetical protein
VWLELFWLFVQWCIFLFYHYELLFQRHLDRYFEKCFKKATRRMKLGGTKVEHNARPTASASGFQSQEQTQSDARRRCRAYGLLAADAAASPKRMTRGRSILSLCGSGGIRGCSSLAILKCLMESIRPDDPPKPCEVFDMIGGLSDNALLAFMLGRLEMSVNECIKNYKCILATAFEDEPKEGVSRWNSTALKRCIDDLISRSDLPSQAYAAYPKGKT